MALTEETIIDKIEFVGEHRHMQLREATVIKRDGVEISRSFHRRVVEPDADTTAEDADIKAVSGAIWTPELKAAFIAEKQAKDAMEDEQ